MKWLDFFSIHQKLVGLFLCLLCAVSYITISSIQNTSFQKANNNKIEIAQQQHLITEQFINAFFLSRMQTSITGEPLDFSEIKKNQFLFEQNLKAMLYGGKTYRDLMLKKTIHIDPIFNSAIREEIKDSQKLWSNLQSAVHNLPLYDVEIEQVTIFQGLHDKLREKLTNTVVLLTAQGNKKIYKDKLYLELSWLITAVLGALLTVLIARNITQPLNNIAKASSRIRLGDLKSYPITMNHHDELGTLVYQSDEMRIVLSELLQKIQKHNKQIIHSSSQINELSDEVRKAHEMQEALHSKLFSLLGALQNENMLQLEQLALHSTSNKKQQQAATESYQSQSLNLNIIEDIQNTAENVNDQLNNAKQTGQHLDEILGNIGSIATKTQALAKKATLDAVRSGKDAAQFTLTSNQINGLANKTVNEVAEIAPLLTQLIDQINQALLPLDHIDQQLNNSLQHSLQSTQCTTALRDEIEKNRINTSQLTQHSEQQILQLSEFETELEGLLVVVKECNQKTEANKLFAQDLNKISVLLEKLPDQFKLDESHNQFRKGNDKRTYPRINNQIAVSIQQSDKCLQGLTQDLSLSGLQIKSMQSVDFTHDAPVAFTINLPRAEQAHTEDENEQENTPQTVTLLGDVIYQEKREDTFYYGVRFHPLNEKDKEKIQLVFDYFDKKSEFKTS